MTSPHKNGILHQHSHTNAALHQSLTHDRGLVWKWLIIHIFFCGLLSSGFTWLRTSCIFVFFINNAGTVKILTLLFVIYLYGQLVYGKSIP